MGAVMGHQQPRSGLEAVMEGKSVRYHAGGNGTVGHILTDTGMGAHGRADEKSVTSSGYGPTLTLAALAARFATAMVS